MPEFKFSQKLKSYEVKKNLLIELERFINEDLGNILNIQNNNIQKDINIQISDNIGTEIYRSIKEYNLSLFSDSTYRIQISLKCRDLRIDYLTFEMDIVFGKKKESSEIRIHCTDDNPRQKAVSIWDGIERILNQHKTHNYIYHLFPLDISNFIIIPFVVSIILIFQVDRQTSFKTDLFIILLLIFIAFFIFFGIAPKLNPYITFDSKKTQTYKKWSNWLLFGFASFILFQVILGSIIALLIA